MVERLGNLFEGTVYGLKRVPSPERGGKVLKQVIATDIENVTMREIWGSDATIELTLTPEYPFFYDFEPDQRDIVAAFYARSSSSRTARSFGTATSNWPPTAAGGHRGLPAARPAADTPSICTRRPRLRPPRLE